MNAGGRCCQEWVWRRPTIAGAPFFCGRRIEVNARHAVIFGVCALSSLAGAAFAATDAPANFGVYELAPAKSSQTTGPLPRELTVIRLRTPQGVKQTTAGLVASGAAFYATYTSKHDGAYVPVAGNAPFDMIGVTQVDADTVVDERKKSGTPYDGKGRTVFTDHGATMTFTAEGTGADGRPFSQRLVFEKR
jgi:hypothetical protein